METFRAVEVLMEKPALFGPDLLLQELGAQLGGEVVNYENNISFLTFHGSGHMVPQFRPQAALHMLRKLINYEALSPKLPLNATLVDLSNQDFRVTMDIWTESAKQAPYV